MGSIRSRLHSVERPSCPSESRWFGQSSRVRANQKPDSPVRTRPLSGISVGRMTSKTEMRSLATSRRRSASSSKISRTLPLATCRTWGSGGGVAGVCTASGIHGLLRREGGEPLEDDVDVHEDGVELEGGGDPRGTELLDDLGVGLDERSEIDLVFPGSQRVRLDEAVGAGALAAGGDERVEDAGAEHEAVRGVE